MDESDGDITQLLSAASSGQPDDIERLAAALYIDMRRLAQSHLSGERPDHTLQPTALVHEAYLKLIDQKSTSWNERLHFLAELDERQARVVELRYFGGCTLEEVASLLGVGRRTIDRDWMAAKAWLYRRLADGGEVSGDDG